MPFIFRIELLVQVDRKRANIMEQRLTKFEKVRILGNRADQISRGAPPLVDTTGLKTALAIAEKELKKLLIPVIIKRTYPNGSVREFSLSEMLL